MNLNPPVDEPGIKLWIRLGGMFFAFLTFRTRQVIDLSQWRTRTARHVLSGALFAVAVATMILALSQFYPGSEGSADFIGWSAGSALAFAAIVAAPMLLGSRLLKLPRMSFILNTVLIQQTLLALGAVFASLILISQEPARTDFSLLQEGKGQTTLAYQRFCGDLEAKAKLHALNGKVLERTASVMRDIDETESWGNPAYASISQAFQHLPRIHSQFIRRKQEIREAAADQREFHGIEQDRLNTIDAFDGKYPTYGLAREFFIWWFIAILALAIYHLWRGISLGDRGDKSHSTTIAAVTLSAAIAGGFVWCISVAGGLPSYREIFISHPADKLLSGGNKASTFDELKAEAAAYRVEFAEEKREHVDEGDELRGEYYRMRKICPNVSNRLL